VSLPGPVVARPIRIAQAFVVFALLAKLWLSLTAPPIGDEAYYWLWGQRLDWSYFDHPPLHAWLLRVVSLLGWNIVTLRLLTWLTLAGTLWIFWLWAKRLKPGDPAAWWWPSVAVYLASLLFFLMSGVTFHDHLLIFLCVATGHAFLVFAERWEEGRKSTLALYGAAVLLGLTVLTKYNGLLLGIGIALFFVLHKPVRSAWRSPHLYLAALLSMAMQAPVIWWNLQRGFVSYNFHFTERWGGNVGFRPHLALEFLITVLLVIGPFVFGAVFRMYRTSIGTPFADRARMLALCVLSVSTLGMLGMSFFVQVFFYWNIVAFALVMPLLSGWFKRRWPFNAQLALGVIVIAGCVLNFSITPIGNLLGRYDWTISSTFGWNRVAERVEALKKEHNAGFVTVSIYTTAAQLAFEMHDPDVTSISPRHDQFDYWFDAKAHIGENAIIVADAYYPVDYTAALFDSVTPLETVPYERLGMTIYAPQIYLGTGFRGLQ
jgi:4-amino-4-deoxy-L-arabinose transferase-like glycosyltransferase